MHKIWTNNPEIILTIIYPIVHFLFMQKGKGMVVAEPWWWLSHVETGTFPVFNTPNPNPARNKQYFLQKCFIEWQGHPKCAVKWQVKAAQCLVKRMYRLLLVSFLRLRHLN